MDLLFCDEVLTPVHTHMSMSPSSLTAMSTCTPNITSTTSTTSSNIKVGDKRSFPSGCLLSTYNNKSAKKMRTGTSSFDDDVASSAPTTVFAEVQSSYKNNHNNNNNNRNISSNILLPASEIETDKPWIIQRAKDLAAQVFRHNKLILDHDIKNVMLSDSSCVELLCARLVIKAMYGNEWKTTFMQLGGFEFTAMLYGSTACSLLASLPHTIVFQLEMHILRAIEWNVLGGTTRVEESF